MLFVCCVKVRTQKYLPSFMESHKTEFFRGKHCASCDQSRLVHRNECALIPACNGAMSLNLGPNDEFAVILGNVAHTFVVFKKQKCYFENKPFCASHKEKTRHSFLLQLLGYKL